MNTPRRFPQAVDDEIPDLRAHGLAHPKTLRSLAITAVMAALTAASGIAGSHWGGCTQDDLKKAIAPLATRADLEIALASESTKMQAYVDKKVETAPIFLPPRPKKRPKQTGEARE